MTINAVNVRFKTNFPNVKTTIITQLNVFGERKYYLWIDKIEPTTVALYYQLSIYQLLKWALYVPPTFIELVQLKGIHDTIARRWNSTKNCTVNDSCCRFVQMVNVSHVTSMVWFDSIICLSLSALFLNLDSLTTPIVCDYCLGHFANAHKILAANCCWW